MGHIHPRRSASDYVNAIKHAAGGVNLTTASGVDLWRTFNDAGHAHVDSYPWKFRNKRAIVTTVAGKSYVELPIDFLSARKAAIPGGTTLGIRETSIEHIMDLQQGPTIATGFGARLYMAFYRDLERDGGMVKVADIYPQAAADDEVQIDLLYLSEWVDLYAGEDGSGEDSGDLVPDIPRQHERALLMLCRAFGIHELDQTRALEDEAYQAELVLLKKQDGQSQTRKGNIKGGAADRRARVIDTYITGYNW